MLIMIMLPCSPTTLLVFTVIGKTYRVKQRSNSKI